MGVLQTYAIGFGVPSAEDIFGLNDDANVVVGEGVIEFNSSSDGDGPEKNRVTSYAEILTEDSQNSETESFVIGMTRLSFIAFKAFEDTATVLSIADINFIEIGKEILSESIFCESEVSPTLSVLYVEEYQNIAGVAIVSAKEDFISPSHSIVIQGEANVLDRDLYSAVDEGLCIGQASIYPFEEGVATSAEYRVRPISGLIANESEIICSAALDTADQYYGLTSTENPFPPPFTANPAYGQVGDGIAIGLGIIKYNRDNFVIAAGAGLVSFTESVGHSNDSTITGATVVYAQELFPTYGTVIGHADIRDLSQVTILNKPAQAYEVVITGAVGDGSQIVYEAINDLVAGEDVVIGRNRPSDPADWWCLGASVVDSSTGTTFTVLSASTGSYSSSPENDGYAIVTSSADRYGVDGLQRYPSVDDYSIDINSDVFVKNINFKYNISALESYTYQAALTAFSGGESFVAGDLVGDPFVLVGDAIVDVVPLVEGGVINYRGPVSNQYGLPSLNNNFDDCFYLEDEGSFRLWNGSSWTPAGGVSGSLTVFLASGTSGYSGQGNPAGIYGTGVYT